MHEIFRINGSLDETRTGVLSNIAMGYIQIPNIAMGGYFCNYTTSGYICNKCKVAIL